MPAEKFSKDQEGQVTARIEKQTARIPSIAWLTLAVGSMVASVVLEVLKDKKKSNLGTFVGLWAPSLLIMGLYNKLVKVEGSDRFDTVGVRRGPA